MIMFIFHGRIVLSGNINVCVVYEQHCVPSINNEVMSLVEWCDGQTQIKHNN
jgi:hypothetical protein